MKLITNKTMLNMIVFAVISLAACDNPINTAYKVTVDQNISGGSVTASPTSGPEGTEVTLNNSPAQNYTFSHYTVDGRQIAGSSFTLNADAAVSGVFTLNGGGKTLVSIRVSALPTKTSYTVGEDFNPAGLVITAAYSDSTANAVTGYTLTGTGTATAGTKTVTVTYEGETTTFTIAVHAEDVTVASITVTKQPAKTNYTVGEDFNSAGLEITAAYSDSTAAPVTGYTLTGADTAATGTKTVIVTYEGATTDFTITVTTAPTYTVTVSPPTGGTITASPTSGTAGTSVTLGNSPAQNYTFSHYTVDGTKISGNTFTLNGNTAVSGVFTPNTYTVTVTPNITGGTISASPTSGTAGTNVTLSNSPAPHYTFSHYTVEGTKLDGNTFPLNGNTAVSGVFTPNTYTVTVDLNITGGTITATPASGTAGTNVTLGNSPVQYYKLSYYTVNGVIIDGNTFPLNGNTTVSGVFTDGDIVGGIKFPYIDNFMDQDGNPKDDAFTLAHAKIRQDMAQQAQDIMNTPEIDSNLLFAENIFLQDLKLTNTGNLISGSNINDFTPYTSNPAVAAQVAAWEEYKAWIEEAKSKGMLIIFDSNPLEM